ncbi:hypothetical protein [Reichenbachiella sp.]|uniref:hypothetical protein n=1 Tax=Reichenbachiella sp. TaxID=2184521 RepID=UPI003BB0E456
MNTINLKQRLNIFEEADTSSKLLGKIEAGKYELLEFKKNFPNADTDYARVFAPDLNQNVWICARYQQTQYAYIDSPKTSEAYNFENDGEAIDEQALVDLLPEFVDFTYDLHKPTYPFPLKNCKVPQAPPAQNNCCTFVEAILVKAWENSQSGFVWNSKNHGQMMIYDASDYYSPVTCLVDRNMAVAIDNEEEAPQPWTVIQGWKEQWKGGHTFIILDHHAPTDRVLTLESNLAYRLNGVGYRMIGSIADHPHPSANWWNNDELWTWERIKAVYGHRKSAKLKVKNIAWV